MRKTPLQESASHWDHLRKALMSEDPDDLITKEHLERTADMWILPIAAAACHNPEAARHAALRLVAGHTNVLKFRWGIIVNKESLDDCDQLPSKEATDRLYAENRGNASYGPFDIRYSLVLDIWWHQMAWDVYRETETFYVPRKCGGSNEKTLPTITDLNRHLRSVFRRDYENQWWFVLRCFHKEFQLELETVLLDELGSLLWQGMASLQTFRSIAAEHTSTAKKDAPVTAYESLEDNQLWHKSRHNIATFLRTLSRKVTNRMKNDAGQSAGVLSLNVPGTDASEPLNEAGYEAVLNKAYLAFVKQELKRDLLHGSKRTQAPALWELMKDVESYPDDMVKERAERLNKSPSTISHQFDQLHVRASGIKVEGDNVIEKIIKNSS